MGLKILHRFFLFETEKLSGGCIRCIFWPKQEYKEKQEQESEERKSLEEMSIVHDVEIHM